MPNVTFKCIHHFDVKGFRADFSLFRPSRRCICITQYQRGPQQVVLSHEVYGGEFLQEEQHRE